VIINNVSQLNNLYLTVSASHGLFNTILAIAQYFCINKVYSTFLMLYSVFSELCSLSIIYCDIFKLDEAKHTGTQNGNKSEINKKGLQN